MNELYKMLCKRQADGKVSTARSLSRGTGSSAASVLQALIHSVEEGAGRLAYVPPLTVGSALYAVPTNGEELGIELAEVIWPPLNNQLLQGHWAARIFVYNTLHPLEIEAGTGWGGERDYLYRELAISAFGKSTDWVNEQHGLTDSLPPADSAATVGKANSGGSGEGKCRICGKPLRVSESVARGIGPECWKGLVHHSGISAETLMDAEKTSEQRLTDLIAMLQSHRPTYTLEEAVGRYPEGVVSIKELARLANNQGISTSQVVKALGGDRGIFPPLNEHWETFLIGRSRYVRRAAVEDLFTLPKKRGSYEAKV